jgi:hypothetical protein
MAVYNVFGTYPIKPKSTHVKRCVLLKCRRQKLNITRKKNRLKQRNLVAAEFLHKKVNFFGVFSL